MSASQAREVEATECDSRRKAVEGQREKANDAQLLATLDRLDPARIGTGRNHLKDIAHIGKAAFARSVERLTVEGIIEPVEVAVEIGSGAKRNVPGLRRRPAIGILSA
jgi:hypothetical protein